MEASRIFAQALYRRWFPEWDAYNAMIGLGWRNKDIGTAIRILPDESLERIPAGQGASTSHGTFVGVRVPPAAP